MQLKNRKKSVINVKKCLSRDMQQANEFNFNFLFLFVFYTRVCIYMCVCLCFRCHKYEQKNGIKRERDRQRLKKKGLKTTDQIAGWFNVCAAVISIVMMMMT